MQSDQLQYFMAFNSIFKLKSFDVMQICDRFGGDAAEAWRNPQYWLDAVRLHDVTTSEMVSLQRKIVPEQLFARFLEYGCRVCVLGDDDYPMLLQQIPDPPLMLFYHGHLPKDDDLCLALIGSRRASPYGYQVAEILARDLAVQGVVIVSGMARGIDGICHKSALAANGNTIAVLGSGLDVIYPREHASLYKQICSHGAVISEFPLGTPALAYNFPRRNRIISGLSRGVVVVEADYKSGTLRTVDYALAQGRDVFAVPGSIISNNSRGTNRLIRDGAVMVLSAQDVWNEYSDQPMKKARRGAARAEFKGNKLTSLEQKILQLLATPKRIDELVNEKILNIDLPTLNAQLTMLEMRGYIKQLPGQYYHTVVKKISP